MRQLPIASSLLVLALTVTAAAAQEEPVTLEGLVVTASPTPRAAGTIANHVTVLDGEELRARGLASVADALRDVAGVDVVRSGSFGAVTSVFMRGGESDYTLVLVDGVQMNQPGGGFDFASLTTDNVERVEIVRGPSSALYGSDAVAGVVHVITTRGRGTPRATVRVESDSYAEPRQELVDGVRWGADLSGGGERFGYSASLSRSATDGVLAFNNDHLITAMSGSARFLPDDRTELALSLRVADREYHFPTDGSGRVVDRNAFTFADETLTHLSVSRRLTDRVDLALLVGLSEMDGGTDDVQDSPADTLGFFELSSLDHFRRASAEMRANVRVRDAVVTAGWELEEERQRSFTESASEFGASSGRSGNERWNRGAFVHASGEYRAAAFNAGARLEDNERYGTIGTWQLGLSVAVPTGGVTRLRGAAGRAIKEPTFFESFATGFAVGNPDLDPERSLAWEVGIEHELITDALGLRATYFDQRFDDLIQFTSGPPTPSDPNFLNVAGASSRGVELGAEGRLGSFRGGVAWTWLDTEVTDPGFDSGPGATFVQGEALLRRPSSSLAVTGSGAVTRRGRLHARLLAVGSRSDRDFSTFPATAVELPGYWLVSLGTEWTLFEGTAGAPDVSVSVRGENLLDERYEEVLGFRAPGRQLRTGFVVRFGGLR